MTVTLNLSLILCILYGIMGTVALWAAVLAAMTENDEHAITLAIFVLGLLLLLTSYVLGGAV